MYGAALEREYKVHTLGGNVHGIGLLHDVSFQNHYEIRLSMFIALFHSEAIMRSERLIYGTRSTYI